MNAESAAPLSDVSGRITHVFFALPSYDPQFIAPMLSCFRGIRTALGSNVRCTVLRRRAQAELVDEALGDLGPLDPVSWDEGFVLRLGDTGATIEGSTLRIGRMALPDFTSWVQDAFLVAVEPTGDHRVWASPHVRRRHGGWDDVVPRRLAEHLEWTHEVLPCAIEAGNVLVDDRTVVVGSDVRSTNTAPDWDLLCRLLAANERSVIVAQPDASQPAFHLDLYLTLAGPHTRTGQPVALVGSVRRARDVLGQVPEPQDPDEALDALTAQLTGAGYWVERLPLLPFRSELAPQGAWYSFNNCLVEVFGGGGSTVRRVVLPSYGVLDGALDADAERTWAGLGFEVRVARGEFAFIAQLDGSVRCMTKVLNRSATE